MRRVLYILLTLLGFCQVTIAQQDLFLTQQIFSRGNINPAGVGNTGDVDIFLMGRLQWLGVEHAPKTLLLNASNYFKRIQSGVGLTVYHDALGVGHSMTEVKAEYSYQIDLNPRWILSMGVSAGAYWGIYDPLANSLDKENERDVLDLPKDRFCVASPDFGLGFELTSKDWTFGVSCTHIQNNQSLSYKSDRHFYGYAVRAIELNGEWDMLVDLGYMNRNKVHVADLGALLFYRRLFWGGLSWRPDIVNGCTPSYLSALLGFEYKILRFGYVYECGLGKNSTLPSNTHEVLLSFRIGKRS